MSDKPSFMADEHLPTRGQLRTWFIRRIQSLQSLDDAVAQTVRVLRETNQLANTVIVFTSDNGYLLGEHSYKGKILAFEQSIRVPLLIRGPGVPAGVNRTATVATIDLAPTFVALAGASPSVAMDGRSLLPILSHANGAGYQTLLVQAGPWHRRSRPGTRDDSSGWFFRGVRTAPLHLRPIRRVQGRAVRPPHRPLPAHQRRPTVAVQTSPRRVGAPPRRSRIVQRRGLQTNLPGAPAATVTRRLRGPTVPNSGQVASPPRGTALRSCGG